ncbi:adhesin [Kitasatospora sp. SolWspMP-SS2h]|uniref:adhesin n=1 Tax=Kitasatospora sp. SolWspMP-SS2h TaxID=1305729 RepID=UPI000DB8F907|nr:adhesin [Kitasatospora sp. SolWspMP-SS2h]
MINGNALPLPGWDGGDGNSAYLDKTLRHQPMDRALDDRVSGRLVLRLWTRGFVASMLSLPVVLVLGSALASSDASVFSLLTGLWLLPALVFWVVFLGSRLVEPIAEWRVLLNDRQDTAESVYAQILQVVGRRYGMLAVRPRRMALGKGDEVSSRVILGSGDCTATVVVFRYGGSLYLGWQMWRTRRGGKLVWQYLVDLVGSVFGQGDLQWAMLRAERVRAMREAVHAACREGLMVAVEQRPVALPAQMGGHLPPVEFPRSASVPVGVVPVPRPAAPAGPAPVPPAQPPTGQVWAAAPPAPPVPPRPDAGPFPTGPGQP